MPTFIKQAPGLPPQDKWAKQYLLYEFYIFLTWLLSFQLFVWLFQVRGTGPRRASLVRRLSAEVSVPHQPCLDIVT